MRRERLPTIPDREPKGTKSPAVAVETDAETSFEPRLTPGTPAAYDQPITSFAQPNHSKHSVSSAQILQMQRTQGNRAVLRMIDQHQSQRISKSALGIQRHSSFEHRLLGDARHDDLNTVATKITPANRTHVLTVERQRLQLWQKDPRAVTVGQVQSAWPDARVLTLKNGLVVTYGELNTMGDYMPNPDAFDSGDVKVILPILQMVRQQGFNRITDLLGATRQEFVGDPMGGGAMVDVPDYQNFKGAIGPDGETGTMADVQEVRALNDNTKNLGTNQYQSLVARNACHFAPNSWSRWEEFHNQARDMALQGFTKKDQEMIRKAWIINGYADHFLQDSFAAGHLINKTLIMQWFVEWVKDYNSKTKKWERNIHLDNADKVEHMTTGEQPGLAGRNLYGKAWTPGSAGTTDPQTAEEQGSKQDRMNASGVQAGGGKDQSEEYNNYLAFLNNSVIQSASGALHNYFNSRSLMVSSVAHKDAYQIWGDDTMVASGEGVRIAGETAHMSQQAIDELASKGATPITAAHIRDQFPSKVRPEGGGEMLPLEQWNDSLRSLCWNTIFPDVHYRLLSTVGTKMGKVSQDAS